ncbi:MAG: hypothetical protein KDC52_13660, partial [Ignavibacteriae bacterium]|nr:hypothetical protein [Ignavibacteriota bacterium]
MRKKYLLCLVSTLLLLSSFVSAQSLDGDWSVDYVTSDSPDSLNSVGYNVISVASLGDENSFVALANRGSANSFYLVAYRNAGKNSGRLGTYPYSETDLKTKWINLFDQEFLYDANDLAAKGNLIYVPNNDSVSNSILVFEVKDDSVYTYPQRYKVNSYMWAIDVDGNGRIYVTKPGDSTKAGSVVVLESPDVTPKWASNGNSGKILQEFTVPDNGSLRGITVNNDGTVIYVSNWDMNKVYCYVGDPVNGYSLYDGFNFEVSNEFQAVEGPLQVGPFGLKLMPTKNLLFVTHDASFVGGASSGYSYGRIFIVNPNTGEILDSIDAAKWNFDVEGVYDNHNPENNASGFTSNYAVDCDDNFNIYTQSWYGWTVDKWVYSSELPTIELTLTSVEVIDQTLPNEISLGQNYPNPFNPSTTIEFQLNKQENISLKIFNLNGELVANLINKKDFGAGTYR